MIDFLFSSILSEKGHWKLLNWHHVTFFIYLNASTYQSCPTLFGKLKGIVTKQYMERTN